MPYLEMPDGEMIHYRGKAALDEPTRQALVAVVEAARAEYDREHAETAPAPAPPPPVKIYTYGYSFALPAELQRYVEALDATIIDVRLTPWSRRPEWQGDALKASFGDRYWRVPALGNLAYKDAVPPTAATQADPLLRAAYDAHGWVLANPAAGLRAVLPYWERGPIILLCGCLGHDSCHRSLVAEYFQHTLGGDVQHLPSRYRDWAPADPGGDASEARGLSLWQPWASLIGAGKWIETRSWGTSYRGTVLIHAAKRFEMTERWQCTQPPFNVALRALGYETTADLPLGAFVARAQLVDCVRMDDATIPARCAVYCTLHVPGWNREWETAFGGYEVGRYAWLLDEVTRFATPIPARGQQGLWPVELPREAA